MAHCCVFFSSDNSVIYLTKSKLTLRGRFEGGEEVEAKFKQQKGTCGIKSKNDWVNYLGKIVIIDECKCKQPGELSNISLCVSQDCRDVASNY